MTNSTPLDNLPEHLRDLYSKAMASYRELEIEVTLIVGGSPEKPYSLTKVMRDFKNHGIIGRAGVQALLQGALTTRRQIAQYQSIGELEHALWWADRDFRHATKNLLSCVKSVEGLRTSARKHYAKNRETLLRKTHEIRARKAGLPSVSIPNLQGILANLQNGQCMYCSCDLTGGYHLDHIIPLALADLLGSRHPGHVPSNLALACEYCNVSKHATLLEDWLVWKYPDQMDAILARVDRHIAILTYLYEQCGTDSDLWANALEELGGQGK